MPVDIVTQNPFAVLSLIAAPAVLTNATSVLALSTSKPFLRAGERLRVVTGGIREKPRAMRTANGGWFISVASKTRRCCCSMPCAGCMWPWALS